MLKPAAQLLKNCRLVSTRSPMKRRLIFPVAPKCGCTNKEQANWSWELALWAIMFFHWRFRTVFAERRARNAGIDGHRRICVGYSLNFNRFCVFGKNVFLPMQNLSAKRRVHVGPNHCAQYAPPGHGCGKQRRTLGPRRYQ